MRKTTLLLLLLIPALACAQIELGPFVFLDGSKASHVTCNLGLGSGAFAVGLAREAPAPKVLEFMNFIPGYAMKYTVAYSGDLYIHASLITRARYQPRRKMIGVFGIGIGTKLFGVEPRVYPNLVLGVDYLLSDKYVLTAALESEGLLTIGFGMHKGYGW